MAASDALSPDQKQRAYRRWQAQMMAAPMDYHTRTVADAAAFAYNNPDPDSYSDYDRGDYDYDDYGDGGDDGGD